MVKIMLLCNVNPSEDPNKVKLAITKIFPDADIVLENNIYHGIATLDNFSRLIRDQKILDATRSIMISNMHNHHTSINLNKQAATVGKISFVDPKPILGSIEVFIEDEDINAVIDHVAPSTINGKEVIS